jgi:hypothetical protein
MRAALSLARALFPPILALALSACAARGASALHARAAQPAASAAQSSAATIQIEYARTDDFLRSLAVTKFATAQAIASGDNTHRTEIIRFEGGFPVWQIRANQGFGGELLGAIPGVGAYRKYRMASVAYGAVPKNFVQVTPDSGPPEPLEPGKYYIVRVERASGSTSYQAMKLYSSGKIESYDAQPRAGESYALCCNVSEAFSSVGSP